MPRKTQVPPPLPPPTRAGCWAAFAKWTLGIPLLVALALGLVWLAIWASGSGGMVWQATRDMGTVLFWLALIVLMYPAMLIIWVAELRAGLAAADRWAALSDTDRAAALAAQPARHRKGR